jgi:hypothetical protein
MIITHVLSKRKGVLREIKLAVRHYEAVVFIKATTGKSIIPVPIEKVRYETYQLVWYLGNQIVHGNPSAHN